MMENIEKRYITEIRANEEDRTITGTAIVFNKESELINGQFREIIKSSQVDPELINKSNIVMLWNHNSNDIPLARSNRGNGTLKVFITPTGVDFSFKAKRTQKGDEILQAVKNGDVDSCSFAFTVPKGGDKFERRSDGTYIRTVERFEELFDFSLVNTPAYSQTSCRSFDEFKETEEVQPEVLEPVIEVVEPVVEQEPVEPIVEERTEPVNEIEEYYRSLDAILNKFKGI